MEAESIYEALRGVSPDPGDRVARDVFGLWLHLSRAYAIETKLRAALSVISLNGNDGQGCADLAASTLRANPSVVEMAEPIGAEVIIEAQRREISALRRQLTLNHERFSCGEGQFDEGNLEEENEKLLRGPSIQEICRNARNVQEAKVLVERAFSEPMTAIGQQVLETIRSTMAGTAGQAPQGRGELTVADLTSFGRLLSAAAIAMREPLNEVEAVRIRTMLGLAVELADSEAQVLLQSPQTTLLALARAVGSQAQSYRDWLIRCRDLLRVVPTSTAAMQKRKAQVLAGLQEALAPKSPLGIYEEMVEGKKPGDVLPFGGPRRVELDSAS